MPFDRELRRHARQLLLPEIGEVGQSRLSSHAVELPSGEAAEIAAEYLRRAGVHAFVTGGAPTHEALSAERVQALSGRSELEHAAAFVAGAFAAVEEIKHALSVGRPGRLPDAPLATDPKGTTK